MIKLGNLERWLPLPQGKVLTLPEADVRRIVLTVNSPGVATLWLVNGDGELQFLAAPEHRDEVEFYAAGVVRVTTDDEHVYVLVAENEPDYVIVDDPEVFTEIAQRAARNPELEKLMYLQQVNMERRLAAMFREFENERQASNIPATPAPAVVDDKGTAPVVDGKGEAGGDDNGQPSGDDKAEDKSAGTGKSGSK